MSSCIKCVIISDRQHVKAAHTTIFFHIESGDSQNIGQCVFFCCCFFKELHVLAGLHLLVNTTVLCACNFLTDILGYSNDVDLKNLRL